MELLHKEISEKIIRCYYKVYNTLGYGFLEKVYENSFAIELKKAGFEVKCQQPIKVFYESELVGEYFADIVINDIIILELKASVAIQDEHECKLLNYLKATNIELGFLFNFGTTAEYKRKIFMNKYKNRNADKTD
jgi:GxxExxY protein